jgi:hypothetical protein
MQMTKGVPGSAVDKFRPEPEAATVAQYAAMKMRVFLDTRLPQIELESLLGKECQRAIDGAYALQVAHGLFLNANSEGLRTILREVLNAALRCCVTPGKVLEDVITGGSVSKKKGERKQETGG